MVTLFAFNLLKQLFLFNEIVFSADLHEIQNGFVQTNVLNDKNKFERNSVNETYVPAKKDESEVFKCLNIEDFKNNGSLNSNGNPFIVEKNNISQNENDSNTDSRHTTRLKDIQKFQLINQLQTQNTESIGNQTFLKLNQSQRQNTNPNFRNNEHKIQNSSTTAATISKLSQDHITSSQKSDSQQEFQNSSSCVINNINSKIWKGSIIQPSFNKIIFNKDDKPKDLSEKVGDKRHCSSIIQTSDCIDENFKKIIVTSDFNHEIEVKRRFLNKDHLIQKIEQEINQQIKHKEAMNKNTNLIRTKIQEINQEHKNIQDFAEKLESLKRIYLEETEELENKDNICSKSDSNKNQLKPIDAKKFKKIITLLLKFSESETLLVRIFPEFCCLEKEEQVQFIFKNSNEILLSTIQSNNLEKWIEFFDILDDEKIYLLVYKSRDINFIYYLRDIVRFLIIKGLDVFWDEDLKKIYIHFLGKFNKKYHAINTFILRTVFFLFQKKSEKDSSEIIYYYKEIIYSCEEFVTILKNNVSAERTIINCLYNRKFGIYYLFFHFVQYLDFLIKKLKPFKINYEEYNNLKNEIVEFLCKFEENYETQKKKLHEKKYKKYTPREILIKTNSGEILVKLNNFLNIFDEKNEKNFKSLLDHVFKFN